MPSLSEIGDLSSIAFIGFLIDTLIVIIISTKKSFPRSTLPSLRMLLVRKWKAVFVTDNNLKGPGAPFVEQSTCWNRRDTVIRYKATPKGERPNCWVQLDRVSFALIEEFQSGSRKLVCGKFPQVFHWVFVIPSKPCLSWKKGICFIAWLNYLFCLLNVNAKELSYLSLLFISLSQLFRCSQQLLRFSAPMLSKVKVPKINSFLVTENY